LTFALFRFGVSRDKIYINLFLHFFTKDEALLHQHGAYVVVSIKYC